MSNRNLMQFDYNPENKTQKRRGVGMEIKNLKYNEMRVPLLMLRLCEIYYPFWNATTHRGTVRHWFINMIMKFD